MPIPEFYTIVYDKLIPSTQNWVGMKTVGRLRYEQDAPPVENKDSLYHVCCFQTVSCTNICQFQPIKRKPFVPRDLYLTKALQSQLPYNQKPKLNAATPKQLAGKRSALVERNTAVVLEPREARIKDVMTVLSSVDKDRREEQSRKLASKQKEHKKACFGSCCFSLFIHSNVSGAGEN